MKHILTYNTFLLEKKADVSAYHNLYELGLIVRKYKSYFTTFYITLYDFKDNIVLGHIEYDDMTKPYYRITRACAKKDWGAVIYDFAIMSQYPNPIAPSNVIMPKAINIWKYYYELRPDVKKEVLSPTDAEYFKSYKNFADDVEKTDDNLKYLNCCYFLEKSNIYNDLIENGKLLLEKYNKKPIDISKRGLKEFDNVYEH